MELKSTLTGPVVDEALSKAAALIESLESPNVRTHFDVASIFQKVVAKLEGAGIDLSQNEWIIWELRLWNSPCVSAFTNQREDKSLALRDRYGKWGRDLTFLPENSLDHFTLRLASVSNAALRARYSDFLAVRKSTTASLNTDARLLLLEAIDAYLTVIPDFISSEETHTRIAGVQAMDSAAHLAICKAPEQLPPVTSMLRRQLELTATQEMHDSEGKKVRQGRMAVNMGWILVNLKAHAPSAISDNDVNWWIEMARSLAWTNGQLQEYYIEQIFCKQAAELARLSGKEETYIDLMYEVASSNVREAIARTEGPGKSYLAGASILENTVHFLEKLRSGSVNNNQRLQIVERIRELKLKIREFYKEGEAELGVVETAVNIDREQLDAMVRSYTSLPTLENALEKLAVTLLPSLADAVNFVNNQSNTGSILSIMGIGLMGDGMAIRSYATDDERRQHDINQALDWQITTFSGIYLPLVIDGLRESKGFTADALMDHLQNWGHILPDHLPLIRRGVEQYFDGDFVSALHILVPQLEGVIRNLFELAGLPSIKPSPSNNGWEVETFGGMLRRVSKELPDLIPADLRVYIERTLSDPTGKNIRNRVAHGMVRMADCDRMSSEIVLHLYLALTRFKSSDAEEPEVE